jgi:hypothetical protein
MFDVLDNYSIPEIIPKNDLVDDINYMLESIEEVHPNPYFAISKEEILHARDSIFAILPDTLTKTEAYLELCYLIGLYKDGHTSLYLYITKEDVEKITQSFPLRVCEYVDNGFIVQDDAYANVNIKAGDTILSVNGISSKEIYEKSIQYFSTPAAYSIIEILDMFSLWVDHCKIYAPFNIEIKRGQLNEKIKLKGITVAEYDNLHKMKNKQIPDYRFEILEDKIAYIEFNKFVNPKAFDKFLSESFKEIKKNDCKGLIIDIRKNMGGVADLGNALIDYFYNKPYTVVSTRKTKTSKKFKEFATAAALRFPEMHIDTTDVIFSAKSGTYIVEQDTITYTPTDTNLRFGGPTCVLIGPKCFSNANSFADLLKTFELTTLIGEPLAMSPTEFARFAKILLPKTKFKYRVSATYFVRVNQDETDHTPIQPDIYIKQSIEDTRKGKDTVLDYAKKWINEQ